MGVGREGTGLNVRPYGSDALMFEAGMDFDETVPPAFVADWWRGRLGVVDAVATERVVVVWGPDLAKRHGELRDELTRLPRAEPVTVDEIVEIPVRYDGVDLSEVANRLGMSTHEVIERHRGGRYVSVMCGFAPGFAYLGGLDPRLRLERRSTPRIRVPAGSVAIADTYTGVYPHSSPGGWHVIGHSPLAVWDPSRDQPALLAPGVSVRFRAL